MAKMRAGSRCSRKHRVAVLAQAPRGPEGDAVSALVHLGYSDARAAEAVARAVQAVGEHSEAPALIREALKGMAR